MTATIRVLTASAALLTACLAAAADWPQYRADAGRTGYSPERLPDQLNLQWTYVAPQRPQPAWPDVYWQRQTYDLAYQPVVAGERLFYGSSADGKVYAIDAATGQPRWSFFTDGPIRFAPVAWRDRLLVASDDGCLYCLKADDGSLLWKRPGGPDRQRILGNGRMVSRCPMRGGPALHDDVLYFGAGVFPSHGFYLHAIDPATGQTRWVNDTAGNIRAKHITGGFAFGNVAAQGYLAIDGDTVVVSTGRAVPAVFDRLTGALKHFDAIELSYGGGSWLMALDAMIFNADMILDRDTGYTLSNKVGNAEEAINIRNRPEHAERMIEAAASPKHVFVGTPKRVKVIDRSHVFDETSDLWDKTESLYFTWRGPMAKTRTPHKFMATRDLGAVEADASGTLIAAGERAYAGGNGVLSAIDAATRKVVWSHQVEGTVHGLAVAEGRLYASTDAGRIYCFAAAKAQPVVLASKPVQTPYADADLAAYDAAAQAIVAKTGLTTGYCLDLACGRGELAYALAKRTSLHIIAVDNEPANVAAARAALDAAGLYGTRVTVLLADLDETHLPNYFANLVVSGRSVAKGAAVAPRDELHRLLRPYGGAAALGDADTLQVERRGALPGAGAWTHQFADPANTSCSGDEILKGPLGVLWFGGCGPQGMHMEKSRSPAPLWIDGRLYVQGTGFLRCIDAYNGHLMWETRITGFPWSRTYNGSEVVGSNYCVTPESVYLSAFNRCRRLDGITGKELAAFETPKLDGRAGRWMQTFVVGDLLFGTLESEPVEKGFPRPDAAEIGRSIQVSGLTESEEATHLFALDRFSGELRWAHAAKDSIIPNSIAFGRGRVYLIDRAPSKTYRAAKVTPPGRLVALDAATGKTLWTCEEGIVGSMLAVSEEHNVVLMGSDTKERGLLFGDHPQVLAALRAGDGTVLWQKEVLCKQRPMIVGRTIIAEGFNLDEADRRNAMTRHYPSAWDLLTGEVRMRPNPVSGEDEAWVYGRSTKCSYVTSCRNMVFFRNAMVTYFDLLRDEGQGSIGGIRPSCFINVLPVGGIVVAPNTFAGCQCNTLLRTSFALEPIEQQERWAVCSGKEPEPGVVKHLRLNLGGPGDRRDETGQVWLAFPRPPGYFAGHRSDTKTLKLDGVVTANGFRPKFSFRYDMGAELQREKAVAARRLNVETHRLTGTATPWVAASCCRGPLELEINVSRMPPETAYRVRLHFAEVESLTPGQRVFDVRVGDKTLCEGLDVVREAGGTCRALVRECVTKPESGRLRITLVARQGEPILNGLEVVETPEAPPR